MTVYLVGAGPGDPGLLTVRGAELLRRCDVVVYDRLAEASLLDLAPPGAIRVDVGKRPGGPVDQASINALLVDHGRAGRTVVRLKGGDPFVLGRGGEEAEALRAAGVGYEVVPGVSAAVAVPAYAGIPVTHRGLSDSFTVVTGHSRTGTEVEPAWEALAASGTTLVVLMGVAHREDIAARLIAGGLSPETPVAAISWGTRPEQRTVRTTLGRLGEAALEPPVTTVIGRVAALDLSWFESRPLFGRRVVVTRAPRQSGALVAALRDIGALPVELPVIALAPPADGGRALARAAQAASGYDWIVLTSANAVDALFGELHDARDLGGVRVAAIGTATAASLQRRGVLPDLVPATAVAEAVVDAMPVGSGRVLLPQAADARPVLAEGLRAKGWRVDAVEAYRTVATTPGPAAIDAAATADAITFLSSSAAAAAAACLGDRMPSVAVCIGEVTAGTAREHGIEVAAVAETADVAGVVAAVRRALTS